MAHKCYALNSESDRGRETAIERGERGIEKGREIAKRDIKMRRVQISAETSSGLERTGGG